MTYLLTIIESETMLLLQRVDEARQDLEVALELADTGQENDEMIAAT